MLPSYRAWIKSDKKMRCVCELRVNGISYWEGVKQGDTMNYIQVKENYDNIELMQSTNTKDKNGKEIFEGDIVKITDGVMNRRKFTSMDTIHSIRSQTTSSICFIAMQNDKYHNVEVIGNIYENKELLK